MERLERLTRRVTTCPDDGLSTFLSVRTRLFRIAYRMLGNSAEAEDIVQDVWMRWQTADRSVVRNLPTGNTRSLNDDPLSIITVERSRRVDFAAQSLSRAS